MNTFRKMIIIMILLSSPLVVHGKGKRPIYLDNKASVDQRVADLLGRMTLEEKIAQLSGAGFETQENKRLGIPAIRMTDGPAGVRWGKATSFPAPIALAASWNPALAYDVARAMAKETRAYGRNCLLAPCVNIHRFPLGGRNFESYGEDPFLAGRLAVSFVQGVQNQGVLSSIKHYACNNQEWRRSAVDVKIDERALQEIYLPAFKAAVQEGKAWTVMNSYNKVNGLWASENNHLLIDILKNDWGFDGFVVSDWGATHHTIESANAGQDLEMPTAEFWGPKLLKAVKDGHVSEATINDKVRRILRIMFRSGIFDDPGKVDTSPRLFDSHRCLARIAAREGMVLLKNEGSLLPLNTKKMKALAVIGPNAAEARTGGGGSSRVSPFYAISPLDALRDKIGKKIKLLYAYGMPVDGDIRPLSSEYFTPANPAATAAHGLWGEYFKNKELKGEPLFSQLDKQINFNWGYDAPSPRLHGLDDTNIFSIRWTGKITTPVSGKYAIQALNTDGLRLSINGQWVIDSWQNGKATLKSGTISLEAGRNYPIIVEYFCEDNLGEIKIGWEEPNQDLIQEAVTAAAQADIAVVFTGLSSQFESESRDRESLTLAQQDRLIKAVVEANPKTVVVINTGSPMTMDSWVDKTPSILQAWYPGQECGRAIVDVLFGSHNPSGKLPFSFLKAKEDSPSFEGYKDSSLVSRYSEGIFVGYRYLDKHGIEPLFPFGHGLSYTTFVYSDLVLNKLSTTTYDVRFKVANRGKRKGTEVVQVYVKDVACSVERPPKELKAFARVELGPGEYKSVSLKLKEDAFSFYDPEKKQWRVEPGLFRVLVGSSATDIRLQKEINVQNE